MIKIMENAPVGPQHPPTCDITDDVSPCKIYMATQNGATRGPEKKILQGAFQGNGTGIWI